MNTGSWNQVLQQRGVSVWLDDLRRSQLHDGTLAGLIAQGITGVTSNPSIFASAIAEDPAYQDAFLAATGSVADSMWTVMIEDVRAACDLLAPVFATSEGTDGLVSLEVSPHLADDTADTVAAARELWTRVDRRNLLIKVPATPSGIDAIRTLISEGISVNATLIFSLDQYRAAHNAYLSGVESALAAGRDIRTIHSVASVFVSRLDTLVDAHIHQVPERHDLAGRAGIANAILCYQAHQAVIDTPRWATLRDDGARPQRLLWASTGVKNPAYDPTLYVSALAVPGMISTLPPATFAAVCERTGPMPSTMPPADAETLFSELAELGVDYGAMTTQLTTDGVAAFREAWTALEHAVSGALSASSRS